MSGPVRYRTTVLDPRGGATGLELPAAVLDVPGAGRRPVPRVTVSRADPAGGVAAGDGVDGEVQVDAAQPVAVLLDDLAAAVRARR